MSNRFQGDPAIQITSDGAKMRFISGQPVMDGGLENAALISLHTREGYWGNVLETEDAKKIGSDYETTCNGPISDITALQRVKRSAERALQWMIDSDLAESVTVASVNPRSDYLKTAIKITPPGQSAQELLFVKNGMNWITQAQSPAHDRFPEAS